MHCDKSKLLNTAEQWYSFLHFWRISARRVADFGLRLIWKCRTKDGICPAVAVRAALLRNWHSNGNMRTSADFFTVKTLRRFVITDHIKYVSYTSLQSVKIKASSHSKCFCQRYIFTVFTKIWGKKTRWYIALILTFIFNI